MKKRNDLILPFLNSKSTTLSRWSSMLSLSIFKVQFCSMVPRHWIWNQSDQESYCRTTWMEWNVNLWLQKVLTIRSWSLMKLLNCHFHFSSPASFAVLDGKVLFGMMLTRRWSKHNWHRSQSILESEGKVTMFSLRELIQDWLKTCLTTHSLCFSNTLVPPPKTLSANKIRITWNKFLTCHTGFFLS